MRTANWSLIALSCTSLVTCAAGCQYPDFQGGRSTARNVPTENDVSRLSDRQVTDVKVSMARSLEQRGETDRALEAYREILDKDPQQSTAFWRMAILYDRHGNTRESEALYRRALQADPRNPDIHCDFGYSLYLQKRWAEAEDHLRQAVAIKSGHRRAHNNLGMLLAQTEQVEEALAEFRKSGCQEAEARANLAFVFTLNRRWDDAHEQYDLALQANPASVAAKVGLENLDAIVAKAASNSAGITLAGYDRPAATGVRRVTTDVVPVSAGRAGHAP